MAIRQAAAGRLPSTGVLLLVTTGVIWGTTGAAVAGVFSKTDLGSPALSWLRFATALPFLAALGWRAHGRELFSLSARAWSMVATLGAMAVISQVAFLYAVREIGVTMATLILVAAIPVLVAVASMLWLGERLRPITWATIGFAVFGAVLLVAGRPTGEGGSGELATGLVVALLAAAGAAMFTLIGRAAGRALDATRIQFGVIAAGTAFSAPFGLWGGFSLDIPVSAWVLILYLGVVTLGVAFLCFQMGLETETATTASVVTLLEPLVAALLAWTFFDERLSPIGWAGGAVLIVSILGFSTIGNTAQAPADRVAPAHPSADCPAADRS